MVDASDIADATGTPCLVDCTGFEKVDKSHGYAPRVVVGVAINVSICTGELLTTY